MTTQKQIEANKQNALLSTGAVTEEGKAIVSKNAIKHGVFLKDLVISSGDGKENEKEYKELLENLIQCLNPNGQMEYLLVEKIAVDFWRLKRVLRFETGSIRKHLDTVVYDYYNKIDWQLNKENMTNKEIDEKIAKQKERIEWNNNYIKCLEKGIVNFEKPTWEGEGIESNIEDDLTMVLDKIGHRVLDRDTSLRFNDGNLSFESMRNILFKNGYKDKGIAEIVIECLRKQNINFQKKISELEQQKLKNDLTEDVNIRLYSLPENDNAEKVMRYERSIQKSIIQNLALLRKLQSLE